MLLLLLLHSGPIGGEIKPVATGAHKLSECKWALTQEKSWVETRGLDSCFGRGMSTTGPEPRTPERAILCHESVFSVDLQVSELPLESPPPSSSHCT
ncbi:hypothetical protein EYF80_015007 [Liparis tanakae]|uniref:Uncharacterized protein n=1 Tax=Liparis tanakae TaxID=230148 RepID=A0A4Z2I9C7_9TELE|nr:hypothetical protein EYF80_015007 [Liparis tanakae]